jgi:hypothetical protein
MAGFEWHDVSGFDSGLQIHGINIRGDHGHLRVKTVLPGNFPQDG